MRNDPLEMELRRIELDMQKSDTDEIVRSHMEVDPQAQPAQVEPQRTRYIVTLLQSGDSNTWLSPALVRDIIYGIETEITTERDNTEIDLWLDSGGGNIDAAYKLVMAIRHYAAVFRVVIPDYAKSAATLLAIGADEIVMGPASELGPLDAQLPHPEREDITISALDMVNAMDHLAQVGMSIVLRGGASAARLTNLPRKEIFPSMLGFSAQMLSPLVTKLDPMLIHQAKNQLGVVKDYCDRLLRPHIVKNRENYDKVKLLKDLPRKLTSEYKTHSFVITSDEAIACGLSIRKADQYEYWKDAVRLCTIIRANESTLNIVFAESEIAKYVYGKD